MNRFTRPAVSGLALLFLAFLTVAGSPLVALTPLEGYDQTKLDNPEHKTPKYLFGRVAQTYSLAEVHDKPSGGELLKRMLPELQAAGLEIREIQGDKILVKTEIGWEWVDVIRGAGAPNPGWWWGSEGKAVAGSGTGSPSSPGNPSGSGMGQILGTRPTLGTTTGGALSTVPDLPEYKVQIDTSSPEKAIVSAATWVKENRPDLFVEGDDRDKAYEMMTCVIGILRANGFPAHRVVNHPSRPVGNPWRYGSDALVLNGSIYDCYGGLGDLNQSRPQALNQGPSSPAKPKE